MKAFCLAALLSVPTVVVVVFLAGLIFAAFGPEYPVLQTVGTAGPPLGTPVVYEPQPDITAYELARIVPLLGQGKITVAQEAALGTAIRHFAPTKSPDRQPFDPSDKRIKK
jgi:hypothetical protein